MTTSIVAVVQVSFEEIFPSGTVLSPPNYIQSYEDYKRWFTSNGGNLSRTKKRHTGKREEGHIQRPANSFMLFRSWASLLAKKSGLSQPSFSQLVGLGWNQHLSTSERKGWDRLAKIVKDNHKGLFPNYQYKPKHNRKQDSQGSKLKHSQHKAQVLEGSAPDSSEDLDHQTINEGPEDCNSPAEHMESEIHSKVCVMYLLKLKHVIK